MVFDYSCAYRKHPLSRGHILQSLTPLYLGRVASFVSENENLESDEVEQKIEHLCMSFERPEAISQSAVEWPRQQ